MDSLCRHIPTKLQIEYIEFEKKKGFDDVEVFAGDFTNRLIEGFKTGSLYSDVTNSLSKLSMESPTDSFGR